MDGWTKKKVENFIILNQVLGKGSFGTVYRGYFANDETKVVAVKAIPTHNLTTHLQQLLQREVDILKRANHTNIVQLFHTSRTSTNVYLFLEYCCDGDLREYLATKQDRRLSELEAVLFFKHVIRAFKLLNKSKVIHRDIKPANILLHQGTAKVSDFGFARVIEESMEDPGKFSLVGSPQYMAPQILAGQPFSAKCDIWSVGMMFYQLLYGRCPWEADCQANLYRKIKNDPLMFPQNPVRSQIIKTLIRQMLKIDEKDRISWEQIFEHPIIMIDEQKIKTNILSFMKDHDNVVRSASLNKIYMDNNLVISYIQPVDVQAELQNCFSTELQSRILETASGEKVVEKDSQKEDPDGSKLIELFELEKKMRKGILRINHYFLFERNIAYYFNMVTHKVINIIAKKITNIKSDCFYKLLFCVAKNQQIHLESIKVKLSNKNQSEFDITIWKGYLKSVEYTRTLNHIISNCEHSYKFFSDIMKRTLQHLNVANQLINDKNMDEISDFMSIIDNEFVQSKPFLAIYQRTIREFLLQLDPAIDALRSSQQTQEDLMAFDDDPSITDYRLLMQVKLFLKIAYNCYLWFTTPQFDFNKFYEEIESHPTEKYQDLIDLMDQKIRESES